MRSHLAIQPIHNIAIQRFLAALCVAIVGLLSGSADAQDSVNVVLGERYGAGGLQRAILGDHYRDAWTSEVRLPVLDLDAYAGGLMPERMGGGQQTISLVFLGGNGRRYSFRLIDKDPTPALPEELRRSVARDLIQDQISSSHPLGVIVVDALEDAAGVLHSESEAFVMPDDPALGEFRAQFANQPGMLAERPGDEETSDAIFGGFENIDGSSRIFRRVAESQTQRVDSRAYLNSRLLDLLIGDWDRHRGQWTWARPADSDSWLPIAEDRDQAFSRLDGLLPSVAHRYARQLVGFEEDYPDIYGLHHQARELDRQFLAELSRSDWNEAVTELQAKMTNQIIDDAVHRLPDAMYAEDGAFISRSLKIRRDKLQEAADELYGFLAIDVEIHLTDLAEHVEITSMTDGRVEVRAKPADDPGDAFFNRVFDPSETNEIRIFMGDSNDVALVGGVGQLGILVRVVGEGGDDEVRYDTNVGRVHYYDSEGNNQVTGSAPSDNIRRSAYEPPPRVEDDFNTPPHSGSWTVPRGGVAYSSEFGLVTTLGATRYGYGFRKDPYASRIRYEGSASTSARFAGNVNVDLYRENSNQHVSLDISGSQFGLSNFYGFGNDSLPFVLADSADVLASTLSVEPRFGIALGDDADFGISLIGQYTSSSSDTNPFLPAGVTPEPLYGAGNFLQAGALMDFQLDTRDVPGAPTKGFTAAVRGSISPALLDVDSTYATLEAVGTTYLSATSAPFEPTLALRAGAKRVWGQVPFFDAAFIGGGSSLRGFDRQRFAGDTAFNGTAELRLFLTRLGFLTLGDFGVLGFADAGRVYIDGLSPGGWHTAFGGGIWVGILGRANGISAVIANSEEGNRLHVTIGMPF